MNKPETSKTKLLKLLERNPPGLFNALSKVINDGDFDNIAIKTANDVDYLIKRIKSMDVYEINNLYCNVNKYLD